MRNLFVSIAAAVAIIVFGSLYQIWAGFIYFALFFASFLAIYWLVILILHYIAEYHVDENNRFGIYAAMLVNRSNLTLDDIEQNQALYMKKFQRSLWKEKAIEWLKMVFVAGVIISCIVLFFTI